MKIIIFDGTFKTTTFINRLVEGLSVNHQVYILGFNEEVNQKIKNIKYIGVGSNSSKFLFLQRSIQLRKKSSKSNIKLFKDILKGSKKKILVENIQLAVDEIKPDIVHFQWVSVLSYLDKLNLPEQTKVVFSQRGFHINVRPFVNDENRSFLKGIFPKIDGFHSVSKAIKEKSNEIYSSIDKIDEVVYSGFEINNLPIKKTQKREGCFKLISVGRNHWKKDYRTAILAMSILKEQGVNFHYTIIGIDKEEELLYLVSDLDLQDNISFIPQMQQHEVYTKMIEADLFLLPSVEEGIANVCIEAMFCKLLVLTTNCGGMEELVDDENTGFVVPIRSPDKIAEKINKILLLKESEIDKITEFAREKVLLQHNEKKMITDMEKLYKKVSRNI